MTVSAEPPGPNDLQDQAARLRRHLGSATGRRGRPAIEGLAALVRLLTVLVLTLAAVAVIVSPAARRKSAEWLVTSAGYLSPKPEPSETVAAARVGPAAPRYETGDQAVRTLPRFRVGSPETPSWVIVTPEAESPEKQEPAAPAVSGETRERAFSLLKKNAIVQKLTSNQIAGYEYVRWEALGQDGDAVRLQIVARIQGEEKKLVWEVNVADGQIRPLSYEARKLSE